MSTTRLPLPTLRAGAVLLNSLGAAKRQEGDLEAALEAYEAALKIHAPLGLTAKLTERRRPRDQLHENNVHRGKT